MSPWRRRLIASLLIATAGVLVTFSLAAGSSPRSAPTTPIAHLVVIFDENQSFDHYFGTYPNAANPAGEPAFTAAAGTPTPDNYVSHPNLLTANPNSANPARLDRTQVVPCDQDHGYADEQLAFHGGAMDKFVEHTNGGSCTSPSTVMNYYDGNTVTALWNLAQHYAMSDAFFGTTYGPSTPGALNLISGNTHGATAAGGVENGTVIGDPDPAGDDCGGGGISMTGVNIGDRMNAASITWGWFQGGFRRTSVSGGGTATCASSHANAAGASVVDYSAHHEPFQYYASTANPHHLPPSSTAAIGQTDQAHHQYDLSDFDAAVQAGNLPQVSFLKAAAYQDGHPGNSGPLDEQRFIVTTLKELEQSPQWSSTAVLIAYDDSDGWYDHVYHAPVNSSAAASDGLTSAGQCGAGAGAGGYQDRCGYGPRLPLLVVSPWAKQNSIDSTTIDQTSILRFIEENWAVPAIGDSSFDSIAGSLNGLFDFNAADQRAPDINLDPSSGQIVTGAPTPTTTTPTPTTPAPPPVTKPAKPKLSLKAKKSGKRLTVTYTVAGLSAAKGKITVTVRLALGKRTIATGKGTVKSGRVKLVLKAKKTLKKGTYVLTTTVTQGKTSTKFTKKLKLK